MLFSSELTLIYLRLAGRWCPAWCSCCIGSRWKSPVKWRHSSWSAGCWCWPASSPWSCWCRSAQTLTPNSTGSCNSARTTDRHLPLSTQTRTPTYSEYGLHIRAIVWPPLIDVANLWLCVLCSVSNVCLITMPSQCHVGLLLGRLLWVDLIKWVSNVRPSVRPSTKDSSISMKFGMQVEVDEWCMMVCSMTRSKVKIKVKVTSPPKAEIRPFSTAISSPIYNGGWQMTTDS